MALTNNFLKINLIITMFMLATNSVAISQEQTAQQTDQNIPTIGNKNVVVETFDEDDLSLVLGGQIINTANNSPWLVYLGNGKLVMENTQNPNSLQYNDIAWVKYPGNGLIETTQDAVISVVIEAKPTGPGGAGILIGSGKAGVYMVFSVDGEGRYYLYQKDGRQLRSVHNGAHEAILIGRANELTFEENGANIAFFANGTEVIQIENPNRKPGARRTDNDYGVGIAAVGTGKFFFERVEISKGR